MSPRKLTRSEIAQLGGLARARSLTPERRREIAESGGHAFVEIYGREGLVRLQHYRHGRLGNGKAPAGKARAVSSPKGESNG